MIKDEAELTAFDLASLLRDVTEVTTRQQSTFENQVAVGGFVSWLAEDSSLPGVRSGYLDKPDKPSETVLQVDLPGREPAPPKFPDLDEGEERSPKERLLLEGYERERLEWERHKKLYDLLFAARMPPENLELVFANGLLATEHEGESFRRHLVTTPAEVQLDRSTQMLRVRVIGASRQELNWTDTKSRSFLGDAAEALRDLQDSQSATEAVAATSMIRSSFGRRALDLSTPQALVRAGGAGLAAFPAVLLRRRDSSYLLKLLREMAIDMEADGFVSEPFQMIVSPTHTPTPTEVITDRAALPLPANEEQRVMIDNARRERHMVIQGPPGTGKTHTIANLASVLMAEGRRVLITAENERALGEVQGKLPEEMRNLMLPMLRERGTGPLQASVNALMARANRRSSPEAQAKNDANARDLDAKYEEEIRAAEAKLMSIAFEDQQERRFQDLTLPLAGHLIHLASKADQLDLVDRYLTEDGALDPDSATALIELTPLVSDNHKRLTSFSFPTELPAASELGKWFQVHRADLATLGDPSSFDHSDLAESVSDLQRLAVQLQDLPPTPWSAITRTPGEYSESAAEAAGLAPDVDHSVTVEDKARQQVAIAMCEEYLALDAGRFDAPIAELVERQRKAAGHAETSSVRGEFSHHEEADELTTSSEEALELLRRDRSLLLSRHVEDHRTQGRSSVDDLVSEARILLEGARDEAGLPVTVAAEAPARHKLAQQAEQLRTHFVEGGKITGRMRTPRAVKEAHELLAYVQVGGSPIETAEEANRAAQFLRYQTQIEKIDAWAETHGLSRGPEVTAHDWLVSISGIPDASIQIRRACTKASGLVRFPVKAAPEDPEGFLTAVLATVSQELADTLDGLTKAASAAPSLAIAGIPVRSRQEGERALAALKADRRRRALHVLLPEGWRERCNPVDVDSSDSLVGMLDVAAAAATVPGQARTADLTPSAVHRIADRAQIDLRRSELLEEYNEMIGGLRRRIAGCIPQSPATQAIDAALEAEDPAAYNRGLGHLAAEVEKASLADRLSEARAAVARAHPDLLAGFDATEPESNNVLRGIPELEQLRDHRSVVAQWKEEVGTANSTHSKLKQLYRDAREAEKNLASARAWDQAVKRIRDARELRSALSALTNAMDAVPKTRTAKTYPARIRALRAATQAAAPAIPCWVMTIDRVAEVLGYPTGADRFDVVIVDEASQAWFPAMFLYAIADQVIIVGDKLQTSPSQVVSPTKLAAIAREHISGHRLEDRIGEDLSLYDIAEVMTGPDMMVDHFRCVPEIIDISNRLSYEPMGRSLQPSRVREPGALEPVRLVRVNGQRSAQRANEEEVEQLVQAVVKCHSDPAYDSLDFGVVVVGPSPNAHLKRLRTRLLDVLGPESMRARSLEVGTASQFQGAERDVMFLSLVEGPPPGERIRVWPHEHTGRNRRNVQALNVAVSRARDQLWIFHSFDRSALSPNDARLILLEESKPDSVVIDEQLKACGSDFERDVIRALASADSGLVIRTQVEALGYAIDIVVEDAHGHRLAVECDGDRWHSSDSQIRSDLYRQRTLETIGWRFHRFLASEWYSEPELHLAAILDELQRSERPSSRRNPVESSDDVEFTEEDEADMFDEVDDEPIEETQVDASVVDGAWNGQLFVDQEKPRQIASDSQSSTPVMATRADAAWAAPESSRLTKEQNRELAEALRALDKKPSGVTWMRAKAMVEQGVEQISGAAAKA